MHVLKKEKGKKQQKKTLLALVPSYSTTVSDAMEVHVVLQTSPILPCMNFKF